MKTIDINEESADRLYGLKPRLGPDGLHLFDRVTGTNILLDEVLIPEERWSTAPRQVSIALTNACDLNCSHCYAPKLKAALDFDLLTGWISTLDSNGCMGIGFGGGEPTLYPKFIDLCKYAEQETNLAVTMTTHGHRLNGSFLDRLSGAVHFVRVSMDGVGATYETVRGRSFDALVTNIERLREVVPFGINYVVNSKTIGDLDDAISIAESVGAAEFLLLPEVAVGKGVEIDSITKRRMGTWVNEYQGPVRLAVSETGSDHLPTCEPFNKESGVRAYAHIDAGGFMKKNSFDMYGVHINDVGILNALRRLEEDNIGVNR